MDALNRFGSVFQFALCNGHVFLLFPRREKSKKTFLGWRQAAIYYMQGELGWLKDILLSQVLVPCSCSVSRRERGQEYFCKVRFFYQMPTMFVGWNVEQGKRFVFFQQTEEQISWPQCAVDAVARIGLACSPLSPWEEKRWFTGLCCGSHTPVRPVRASCNSKLLGSGSVCASCVFIAVSGSCGSVCGSRSGSRTFLYIYIYMYIYIYVYFV